MDFTRFVESGRFRLFQNESAADRAAFSRFQLRDGAFATPPAVTTLRLVRPLVSEAETDAAAALFATLAAAGHQIQFGLPGLPECILVRPSAEHPLQPGGVALCADRSNSATREETLPMRTGAHNDPTLPVGIVVDSACGEAVLRGSSVFAPGIIASTTVYEAGQPALLFAPLDATGKSPFLKGSFPTPGEIAATCVCLAPRGAQIAMCRAEVQSAGKGVAVTVDPTQLFGHPALGNLPPVLQPLLFLQNHSSFMPAVLLKPEGHHRVLDMCAAPGGKSSHILSIVRCGGQRRRLLYGAQDDATSWVSAAADIPDFSLTCCERSSTRAKQLAELLQAHHGTDFVRDCVQVLTRDVNKLGGDPSSLFDRILLDPPCTGLGLRPRLRAHEHTPEAINMSADYQRKLIRTAASLLKPGGILTYSTCTLSKQENEETVRWTLANLLELELDTVRDEDEAALASMAAIVHSDIGVTEEAVPDVSATRAPVCCWTFLPRLDPAAPSSQLDSVGFFVARFRKR